MFGNKVNELIKTNESFYIFYNFLLLNGGVCGSVCINVQFILFSVRREIPNLDKTHKSDRNCSEF